MTGFTPFEFDESVAQTEPGRPHVPEGYYKLEGVKLEPTPQDYEKTTGVFATWKFKEGPGHAPTAGVGREIRDYVALGAGKRNDRGTQFGFGMLLGAVGMASVAKKLSGVKVESYAQFAGLINQINDRFAGKETVALIADQAGNQGRAFSSIEEYLPAEEWPNLKGAQFSAQPRAATNGATTAVSPATPAQVQALKDEALSLFSDD